MLDYNNTDCMENKGLDILRSRKISPITLTKIINKSHIVYESLTLDHDWIKTKKVTNNFTQSLLIETRFHIHQRQALTQFIKLYK